MTYRLGQAARLLHEVQVRLVVQEIPGLRVGQLRPAVRLHLVDRDLLQVPRVRPLLAVQQVPRVQPLPSVQQVQVALVLLWEDQTNTKAFV